ncbi:hypothetical protein Patl1_23323 [Pistacia atlantica]|uniref:Uncharacterized protein n=1 Tax=Pistacia atlantica TaxID=434234 RepID=A0ACC0ZVA2_9ROSI|nr:hypothetical protein Patl1_23323 [Pistacia atlantica]
MGLSGIYNDPVPEEVGISIIKHAFDRGITFFDTSDVYGPHTNEILVGKALKHLPRDKVQLATKFGIVKFDHSGVVICGTPEFVRSSCEASLKRLDVEYIDLYYQHRVDTYVPIEDTMGELKKLVEEGKIKYIGLSEASPDTIRRVHAVPPITALQIEWELGIAIVPYRTGDFLAARQLWKVCLQTVIWHTGENLDKNKVLYWRVENLAKKHGCNPAQLALSWILHQGDDVVPIPGTAKINNLDSNVSSLNLKLTNEDLQEISAVVAKVAEERTVDYFVRCSWKFANTPKKHSPPGTKII